MEILSMFVGFAGVILTLVFNARMARRQQERQWAEGRRAVREGLIVELQSLYDMLHGNIKTLEKEGEPRPVMFIKPEIPIYLASLTHLGRLTDSEVAAVFAAYQAFLGQEQAIRSLLSDQIRGEAYRIPVKNLPQCKEILDPVLPKIKKALEELRKNQD